MSEYGLISLLPPVLTVAIAMWSRNIIISLCLGTFCGSLILSGYNPFNATLDLIERRIFVQISSPSNIQIIFTMMAIGGFIKLLEVSGGAKAFARSMTNFISNKPRAQLSAWISGVSIFFTDSGNALIIGPLFRPIFKELKICKEKLAYILDSTSSPICILMPFIGWGAYIMGLIDQAYLDTGLTETALSVLINLMPYQFYAILCLSAVPMLVFSGRDFGPMKKAQLQYEALNQTSDSSQEPSGPTDDAESISLFVVPLAVLLTLIAGLLVWHASNNDLTSPHIRSSLTIAYISASLASAILMLRIYKISLADSLDTFVKGTETMVFVVIILILAWSLSSVIKDLGTAQTLSVLIGQTINPAILPALVFILGAVISLATGSSWGTFAILMALAIPVAHNTGAHMYLTIAAVLSGGLFGDHTSPISDTTVLASIGADCPHIDHVTTQFSYAMVIGSVTLLALLIAGFYPKEFIIIPAIVLLFVVFQVIARKSESRSSTNA
jgi:Na+/H+ antiporter NhaC